MTKITGSEGNITGAAATNLTNRITSFYERIKTRRDRLHTHAKTTDDATYTLDSAAFLIESAYNLYTVVRDDSALTSCKSFQVTEQMSSSLLSEESVADAFYQIRDSLMALYDEIDYSGKVLTFLDLVPTSSGNTATFKVTGYVSKAFLSFPPCPATISSTATVGVSAYNALDYVSGSPLSVTSVTPSYTFSYVRGQGDLIAANMSTTPPTPAYVTNITNAKAGAAYTLRSYALQNYNCGNARICGYYVNVTTINAVPATSTDKWSTVIAYADPYFPLTEDDFDIANKKWINAGMMDFYRSKIPSIFSSNIPGGKTLYDFNIYTNTCLCAPYQIGSIQYGLPYWFDYKVSYGDYVTYCGTGITLPNL